MPEFILDHGTLAATRTFAALDDFTRGYIEAAFFTDTGHMEDEELEHATLADLAPDAWLTIIVDCGRFQRMHEALLEEAISHPKGYTLEQAGRDFWFTRNGHGVGYWDRGLGAVGVRLTATCGWRTEFPEVSLYRGDDGHIYVEGT